MALSAKERSAEISRRLTEIASLRKQIDEHRLAIKQLGATAKLTAAEVAAAYKETPDNQRVADRFGLTVTAVMYLRRKYECQTGEKLPRSARAERAVNINHRDPLPIIEAYRENPSLVAVAMQFGLTRERVRQLVVAYEKARGTRLPRTQRRTPRVSWTCSHCGTVNETTKTHIGDCKACKGLRSRGSRFDDPVLLEEWIARRRAGASWASLAKDAGLKKNAQHLIPRAIWMYLRRERREDEVPSIWRGDSTRYLARCFPMRTEGPRVATNPPKFRIAVEISEGDTRLIELANQGLSASQIGEKLGLSRNAVIGRAYRRGIPLQGGVSA